MDGFNKFLEKLASYSHVTANTEASKDIEYLRKHINELEYCEIVKDFPRYVIQNEKRLREINLIDSPGSTFN